MLMENGRLIPRPPNPSAVAKWRLKFCIFLHFSLIVFMLAKLLDDILDKVNYFIPWLAELDVPKPLIWEYFWLLGVVPSIFGLCSLNRNRLNFMRFFYFGTFILGILPVTLAAIYMLSEAFQYSQTRQTKNLFQGYPLVVLWYMFFACAIQVHVFSVYFGGQLLNAWRQRIKQK